MQHLLKLKRFNRQILLQAHNSSIDVASAQEKVDAHFLQLQNLTYKRGHLLREIEKCQSFQTEQLDKIDLIEPPVEHSDTEHGLMLARLQHELDTRKQ